MQNLNSDLIGNILKFIPLEENNVYVYQLGKVSRTWRKSIENLDLSEFLEEKIRVKDAKNNSQVIEKLRDLQSRYVFKHYYSQQEIDLSMTYNYLDIEDMIDPNTYGENYIVHAVDIQGWKKMEKIIAFLENRKCKKPPKTFWESLRKNIIAMLNIPMHNSEISLDLVQSLNIVEMAEKIPFMAPGYWYWMNALSMWSKRIIV